jgi:flagellar hook assembly protein FlgD
VNAASRVHIAIYDLRGALVKTLVDGTRSAGAWSITWNGEDDRGARVSSGVYFCRMRAGTVDETRKMVLLK